MLEKEDFENQITSNKYDPRKRYIEAIDQFTSEHISEYGHILLKEDIRSEWARACEQLDDAEADRLRPIAQPCITCAGQGQIQTQEIEVAAGQENIILKSKICPKCSGQRSIRPY